MLDSILEELKKRLSRFNNLSNSKFILLETNKAFNVGNIDKDGDVFVNFELANNIRRINKFHEKVNRSLCSNGIYISCAETLEERRERIKNKIPFGFKNIFRVIDFIYKRVFPKILILNFFYFSITKGHNRVISKAEILGRLISCGFEILEYFEYEKKLYIISKKNKKPDYNMQVSYGPLFKMKRIGFNQKVIGVYKLRTMYPYSEYCQDLIINENKLSKTGKVENDFRITTWGKIMRKFWIDELPNIINFFKREMKLIGVRPVSKGYFDRFPEDLRELRTKTKPACIGIHYSVIPRSKEDVIDIEIKYLQDYFKNPFITDTKYFFYFIYNIIFKNVRSK